MGGLNNKKGSSSHTSEALSLSFRSVVLKGMHVVRPGGTGSHKAGLTFRKDPRFRLLTFSTHEVICTVTRDTMTGLKETCTSFN